MTFGDVDIAVRGEGDHHRLPEQPLSFGFVPVPAASALADRHQELPFGTDFHHRRTVRGGNPDIVRGIDRHPVRLVLVADHVGTDLKDQPVIRIELEQLRLSAIGALKGPQISLRVESDGGDAAESWRQHIRIRERVPHRLFPLHALERLT